MTGVRHLLLSVVAAVLALALGLALGAGPVVGRSDATRGAREDRLAAQSARLQDQVAALERQARTDARVVAAVGGRITDGRLEGHSVLLVRTPGATDELVRRTRAALLGAGASLTGELTLTSTYVDPAKATAPLEDLALRLVPPNVEFAPGASAIERVGTVLARSTVAAEPESETDQDAAALIAGLDELGAVRLDGDPGRLAELAVVVSGPRTRSRPSRRSPRCSARWTRTAPAPSSSDRARRRPPFAGSAPAHRSARPRSTRPTRRPARSPWCSPWSSRWPAARVRTAPGAARPPSSPRRCARRRRRTDNLEARGQAELAPPDN